MRLNEVLEGLPLQASAQPDAEVTGITHDSRRVQPGDLFVALVGERFDGREFIGDATRRGAVAVLASGAAPAAVDIPWIEAADPRQWMGELAGRIHGHPDRALTMVGVTGTNGKSTVVALMASILEAAGRPAGRIGTLGYRFHELEFEGERTTPEATDLFAALAGMRQAGARAVAMEVSSHALSLGRVQGVGFDVAIFTNLTRDHFDFHDDFEAYYAAKRSLFDQLKPAGRSAVYVGDAWGRRLAAELQSPITCGPEGMVRAEQVTLDAAGTRARIHSPAGEFDLRSPLIGAFNLANLLAAVGGAVALELPVDAIVRGVEGCPRLPGRLEPVDAGQPFPVLVDFAHTDAALRAAIRSVRELHPGRLILVFGCGGDRDPGKRALMGQVAGEMADLPIVTTDNPRSEDPLAIIAAIEEGLERSGNANYRVVPDRREAILRAISIADRDSAVLIAGKGSEQVQIVNGERLPFSDREEARKVLEELYG